MRYVLIVVGLLIVLQTVGIDLTTLNILTGSVGLGIGFGLQNIAINRRTTYKEITFTATVARLFLTPQKLDE